MKLSQSRVLKKVVVTFLCVGIATLASYYLYLDFLGTDDVKPGSGIAEIKKSHNSVRRKAAKSFLWKKADQGQELQLKDSVQTSDDSAAAITLKTGAMIELGPNSLFVLNNTEDLSLGFLQGTVVMGENGQSFKFEADPKTGQIRKVMLPASLQEPLPFADFFAKEDRFVVKVSFQWSAAEAPDANTQVQISKTKDFKNARSFAIHPIKDKVYETVAEVEGGGEWHWRVVNANKAVSQERVFRTQQTFALKPSFPKDDEVISSIQANSQASFSWQPVKLAPSKEVRHVIEISTDENFKTTQISSPIQAGIGNSQIGPLSYGRYYWRIVGDFSGLREISPTRSFALKPKRDFNVSLDAPLNNSMHSVPPPGQLDMAWTPEENLADLKYEVILNHLQPNGETKTLRFESPTNHLRFQPPSAGRFEWKIVSWAKSLKIGETKTSSFSVFASAPLQIIEPAPQFSHYYWKEKTPVTFKWKNNGADVSRYQIEFARDDKFQNIFQRAETRSPSLSFNNFESDGRYYWRVLGFNRNNVLMTASNAQDLEYALHPPLKGPAVSLARKNRGPAAYNSQRMLSFDILQDSSTILAGWPEQEFRQSSLLKIYHAESKKVVFQKLSPDLSLPLPALKPGNYQATLQPLDILKRPGEESEPLNFEITLGDPLPAPRSLSAEVQ